MGNPEQKVKFNSYFTDDGYEIGLSIDPKTVSRHKLRVLLRNVIQHNMIGDPIQIHIVFPGGPNIFTEQELVETQKMDPNQSQAFRQTAIQKMALSETVVVFRKTKNVHSRNLFKEFVEKELKIKL